MKISAFLLLASVLLSFIGHPPQALTTDANPALATTLSRRTALSCAFLMSTGLLKPASAQSALTSGEEPGILSDLPGRQGISTDHLIQLTDWLRTNPAPVFSVLISRRGKLVYELYTSQLQRPQAHYLMSVTKSVLSTLMGISVGSDFSRLQTALPEILPRAWFKGESDVRRMRALNLQSVMGMSALNNPDPPRDRSPESYARMQEFINADSRVKVALSRPLLPDAGSGFQYNDVNPAIAAAAVAALKNDSPFAVAQKNLFGPLQFQNAEWMHQDRSGLDMGGYGLRLRPIDMQKLGILYWQRGQWQGRQVLPPGWTQLATTPWIQSRPELSQPNYGWYWWSYVNYRGARVWEANGWRGQRIYVLPGSETVITITANIEDTSEEETLQKMMNQWILPAIASDQPLDDSRDKILRLESLMAEVQKGAKRWGPRTEDRMIPAVKAKEDRRHAFRVPW